MPVLRPADAHLQELAASDASACARLGAMDANSRVRQRSPLVADVEKLAGRARDVRERDVHRRSELQVARAEETAALEPCKQAAARSVAQSCAARDAVEQPEPSRLPRAAEPMRKSMEELLPLALVRPTELAPLVAV